MNSDTRPSFGYRLLLALVKTILAGIILIVLVVGGYYFVRELRRSFDSVSTRVEINRRDLDALRSQVDTVMVESPERRNEIEALQTTVADLDDRLQSLQTDLADDLDRQQQMLTTLEENVAKAAADGQTATEDTAALGTALVALQGDFNETNGRVDALGGEIDGLRADNGSLNDSIEVLSRSVISATEKASNVIDMKQTLVLFHIWELVARARLRLVEDNVGLATEDLERALRAVDIVVANEPGESEEGLRVLQTRLALARASLPANPLLAAGDLESVWDELDRIVTARVLPELLVVIETATAAPSIEEAAPEAALEPAATPAPETTPEPVAEPTATTTP